MPVWQSIWRSWLSGLWIVPSHQGWHMSQVLFSSTVVPSSCSPSYNLHLWEVAISKHCTPFLCSPGQVQHMLLLFPFLRLRKIFRIFFLRTAGCCFLEIEFWPWGRLKGTTSASAFNVVWHLCLMERVPKNVQVTVSRWWCSYPDEHSSSLLPQAAITTSCQSWRYDCPLEQVEKSLEYLGDRFWSKLFMNPTLQNLNQSISAAWNEKYWVAPKKGETFSRK